MKKKLRDELMENVQLIYLEILHNLFPTIQFDEKQHRAFIETWKRSPFRKGLEELLRKFPDEQFPLFQNLLRRFPLEVQKHAKALRLSANTFGGRTPLLPDKLRREACEEVKSLQQRGFRLHNAISEVASQHGITAAQLMGIWKHRMRYKG